MSALTNPTPTPIQKPPQRITPVAPAEPPRKGLPWTPFLVLAVIGAAIFAGYQFWLKPQQEKVAQKAAAVSIRTAKVIAGPFERSLRVGGTTAALKYAHVTAPRQRGSEGGSQMELVQLARNGSWVDAGATLAQIDPGDRQDHMDDIRAQIEQAGSDVLKRQAEQAVELGSLMQTLRVAQATVDKSKLDSQAAEVRTDIERELLRLAYDEALAKYKQSELDVPQKKVIHAAELKILGFTEGRHGRHLLRHDIDLKSFTMKSPMKGMVVMASTPRGGGESQQVQSGDQLRPGQPLMKIVDPANMQLEATVNQAESPEIRIGQQAILGFDAFPGLKMKARVYSIGALAVGGWRQNYYIRSVPVRLTIDGADPRMIPDLSAFADIVLERKDQATLVPLGAIHEEGDKSYVYVRQGEDWAKREIAVDATNNLYAAASAGVSEGDELRLK